MAYGFNEDRSKVEVYTAEEIDAMDLVNDEALADEVEARQAAMAQEIANRQAGDNSINARVDNMILAQDLDPNKDSELVDIRHGVFAGADHATAGEAVRNQVSSVNRLIKAAIDTNVLFQRDYMTVTGTGNYVYLDAVTIDDIDVTKKYTVSIDSITGASNTSIAYATFIQQLASDDTQISQAGMTVSPYTFTPNTNTRKLRIRLYPAQGSPLPTGTAVYHNVKVYLGEAESSWIKDSIKYQRLDDDEIALQENIDKLDSIMSKSRNIATQFVDGYINVDTGAVVSPAGSSLKNYSATKDAIEVKGNTAYRIHLETSHSVSVIIFEYDSNGSFIGRKTVEWQSFKNDATIGDLVFISSNNTKFIRIQGMYRSSINFSDDVTVYIFQAQEGWNYDLPVNNDIVSNDLIDIKTQYDSIAASGMISDVFYLPDYYHDEFYIENKVDIINSYLDSSMANGDAFIFITDEHWEQNAQNSLALLKYIHDKTTVNKLFSGGDISDMSHAYDYPNMRDFALKLRHAFPGKIYHCIGNHDVFKATPMSRLSALFDMYNDDYNGNPEKHYYYVDNKRSKIRYIVLSEYYYSETDNDLNGFPIDQDQQDWFQNVALNLEQGWGAVIFIHFCWYGDYDNLTLHPGLANTLFEIVNNYDGDGEIICIMQGHTHSDRILHTNGNSGIPVIITTCDKYNPIETPSDIYPSDRSKGTIREQAFDVVVIDRENREINIIRIGCEAYDGTSETVVGNAAQIRTVQY